MPQINLFSVVRPRDLRPCVPQTCVSDQPLLSCEARYQGTYVSDQPLLG